MEKKISDLLKYNEKVNKQDFEYFSVSLKIPDLVNKADLLNPNEFVNISKLLNTFETVKNFDLLKSLVSENFKDSLKSTVFENILENEK